MEEPSSPREDSKSSSGKTDRPDQYNEHSRSRIRSYECMFCKKGFTTAQALGGHMNIHRKHKASVTSPNYSTDHRCQDPLVSTELADHDVSFLAIQSYPQVHFGRDHQMNGNHQPSNSSNNLLRENWICTSLSLGIGATRRAEEEEKDDDSNKKKINGDFSLLDNVDVDLELRLGYDT